MAAADRPDDPAAAFTMIVVDLCRSCAHDRAAHQEDGRCTASIEMLVDEAGGEAIIPCDCPGWPGRGTPPRGIL